MAGEIGKYVKVCEGHSLPLKRIIETTTLQEIKSFKIIFVFAHVTVARLLYKTCSGLTISELFLLKFIGKLFKEI